MLKQLFPGNAEGVASKSRYHSIELADKDSNYI